MRTVVLYAKLVVLVSAVVVAGLIVFKNRHHQVTVWFFGTYESVNVVRVMLCTAGASVATWRILAMTHGVWRDFRDLQHAAEVKRHKDELDRRTRELAEVEKRLDAKSAQGDRPGDDETETRQ